MSLVVQPVTGDAKSDQTIDPEEDWTEIKQRKLEEYIKQYVKSLSESHPHSFYKRINWAELINVVGVNDQEFLQLKVDEIYDDMFDQWDDEGELDISKIISGWKNKGNPLYCEIVSMIETIGLEQFKVDLPEPHPQNVEEQPIERMTSNIEFKNVQRDISGDNTVSEPRQALPKVQSRGSLTPQVGLPQLTKKQRRLSLDLMHPKPTSIDRGNVLDESILTAPAGPETTTVNVITKAEVGPRAPMKSTKSTLNKSHKKFSLLGTKKKTKSKTNLKQNEDKGYTLSSDRRRISLVGESLPLYIRNQLTFAQQTASHKPSKRQILTLTESPKISPVVPAANTQDTDEPSASSSPESVVVKSGRLQNLLANSQSLYAHSKDNREMATGISHSHTQTTNTSENTSQGLHYDSDDEDKEYISPDSLTRYYGLQLEGDEDDEEEILNEIEESEENGFVNVYGNFSNDVRDENNSIDDIDDDYLFKI